MAQLHGCNSTWLHAAREWPNATWLLTFLISYTQSVIANWSQGTHTYVHIPSWWYCNTRLELHLPLVSGSLDQPQFWREQSPLLHTVPVPSLWHGQYLDTIYTGKVSCSHVMISVMNQTYNVMCILSCRRYTAKVYRSHWKCMEICTLVPPPPSKGLQVTCMWHTLCTGISLILYCYSRQYSATD